MPCINHLFRMNVRYFYADSWQTKYVYECHEIGADCGRAKVRKNTRCSCAVHCFCYMVTLDNKNEPHFTHNTRVDFVCNKIGEPA